MCTNIISVLFLFFFHFSPVYVSCAPFLIKLAIPLNTTAAFVAFIGFIAFVLLNFRTCSCYAVFYGVWSLEYNFTLNRLCIHRNDYSLSEWSHSLNALWNNRSIFFSRLNGMCFARVENVWEISNFQCRRYRLWECVGAKNSPNLRCVEQRGWFRTWIKW